MRGLCALLTISFAANAIANQWAFDFSKHGPEWIAADLALAFVFGWLTMFFHRRHERQEMLQMIAAEDARWEREQAAAKPAPVVAPELPAPAPELPAPAPEPPAPAPEPPKPRTIDLTLPPLPNRRDPQ